ncbi:amino acid/polyamine transporter I [Mycena crocata]|nr:amino acid/polyamine transporter I [Mycena crocata]
MSTTSPISKDDEALAKLGYKQEFKRNFSPLELFGVGFSIIGVVPAIASVLVYAIANGGPVAMVWGWATASFFIVFVAMAMAELGSAAPTSGGLYYWTFRFSSPRYRNLLSWVVGYTNGIAYISGVAGVEWGCAVQIMAAVSIATDFSFAPTIAQTYGVYCALLICHGVITSLTTHFIAKLQTIYIAMNLILCMIIIIGLPAATPSEFKNTAGFALGSFTNFNAWPNGYDFILSFLSPTWVVSGFDASVHVSEEARNASVAVPWAIISASVLSGVLGWAINVSLVFCMGTDVEAILSSPIGQPMATILFNSFGKKGTLVVWSFLIIVQFMIGTTILTASSRENFAFARDGGLPFSSVIYRINRYSGTPVNSVWVSATIAGLMGLLAFAGPVAIGALFTLSVVAQYISDSIPIAARFLGENDFRPGPFSLGRFSLPVAIVAVTWMLFMSIVLLFPSVPQVTATDINYSVVVVGGFLILSITYYYFPGYGGKTWFKGPIRNLEYELPEEGSVKEEKGAESVEKGSD